MPNGTPTVSNSQGAWEVGIAQSNSSDLYMVWGGDGCFYSSTNKGAGWTKGGPIIGASCTASDPNQSTKYIGPYMAIDPQNPSVIVAATPGSGSAYSTNHGTSFTVISALGSGTNACSGAQACGTIFAYDPTSGVSGGQKQGIYGCTYGTGVFHTTGGPSGTWNEMNTTNMPTTCVGILVDATGVLWLLADGSTQNIYSCNATCQAGGAWTHETPTTSQSRWQTITYDPAHCATSATCHLTVFDDGGGFIQTSTGSGGFGSEVSQDTTDCPPSGICATDAPWLGAASSNHWTVGTATFDPHVSNTIDVTIGIGLVQVSPNGSSPVPGNSLTTAMDGNPVNRISSGPGSSPFVSVWDRGVFLTNTSTYPTSQVCGPSFNPSWSSDWASTSPTTQIVECGGGADLGDPDTSGYVVSGVYHQFGGLPSGWPSATSGSCVAAATGSKFLWVWNTTNGAFYSSNTGASWTAITASPMNVSGGWGASFVDNRQNCAADRVNSNIYIFNDAGGGTDYLFACSTSSDCSNGANWTQECTLCKGGGSPLFASGQGALTANLQASPVNANTLFLTVTVNGGAVQPFYKSTNAGATWTAIANVSGLSGFGFGKGCNSDSDELYIYGTLTGTGTGFGLFRSGDEGSTWTQISVTLPSLDYIKTIEGDKNTCGTVYIGFNSTGVWYHTN